MYYIFHSLIFLVFTKCYILLINGYNINDFRSERQSNTLDNGESNSNETDFEQQLLDGSFEETLLNTEQFSNESSEEISRNTTEKVDLFWTVPNSSQSAEEEVITEAIENDSEILNESLSPASVQPSHQTTVTQNDESSFDNKDLSYNKMNQKIVLQRNNCILEVSVTETSDLKVEIEFGKLENNTSGKCCITLIGNEHSDLAVLISNVKLYENVSQGEVLKVVLINYGWDFVIKEYRSGNTYEPLLLTEAHKVYIQLFYKVAEINSKIPNSHFNLEVFTYHKNTKQNNVNNYFGLYNYF